MTDSIQIPYSKNFTYFSLLGILGMASMFFSYIIEDLKSSDIHTLIFEASFEVVLLLMGLIFINKFFIPSIKGFPALELNKDTIIDNVRHRKIYWSNISEIRMTGSQWSTGIALYIIDKNKIEEPKNIWNNFQSFIAQLFIGTRVVISNKFIKGTDKEIFAQVLDCFERQKNCT